MTQRLELERLSGRYAVCRLAANAAVPDWAIAPRRGASDGASDAPPLISITRTEDELSIVAPQNLVESIGQRHDLKIERDFVAWRIVGTLDFSLVGVLAKLTGALADAGVPVFVISTFDTDMLLVRAADADAAANALQVCGAIVGR